MKFTFKSASDEEFERRDYRDFLIIEVDGEQMFKVMDGEPEDSNLARDFNDCCKIPDLLKLAHQAGKAGQPLDIGYIRGE